MATSLKLNMCQSSLLTCLFFNLPAVLESSDDRANKSTLNRRSIYVLLEAADMYIPERHQA